MYFERFLAINNTYITINKMHIQHIPTMPKLIYYFGQMHMISLSIDFCFPDLRLVFACFAFSVVTSDVCSTFCTSLDFAFSSSAIINI